LPLLSLGCGLLATASSDSHADMGTVGMDAIRRKRPSRTVFFLRAEARNRVVARPKVEWAKAMVPVSIQVNHPPKGYPVSSSCETIAGTLAMLSPARRCRKRACALVKDRTLQTLVTDLVAARTAAGMTQHEVAMRMWTTKSAVSRLESGCYARPTLGAIEKYALAVGARVDIRVRPSR
jgi:predicted XRE-type DNA-binding protein